MPLGIIYSCPPTAAATEVSTSEASAAAGMGVDGLASPVEPPAQEVNDAPDPIPRPIPSHGFHAQTDPANWPA